MGNERTLFEKLLDPDVKPPRTARQRKEMIMASIVRHLGALLNSRQGCCEAARRFGMPDLECKSEGKGALAHELETEIRNTISRNEPRLERVQVRMEQLDEDRLTPRFIITAQLTARDDFPKDVSFSTVVDPVGKIQIS